MSNLLRSLISGGSRVARGVDDADAVRYLDELTKAERYADQVRYLDEFYNRTPDVEPVVEVATRTPTTAEQFLAAGIPMPSAARRLADAADDAASAGLGPDNALLREWVDSQVPLPSANPRGSQRTAIEAIGDSWDTQLRNETLAPLEARRRRADLLGGAVQRAGEAVAGAAGSAASAAAGLGRGAAGVVREMGPMPLTATGVGAVAAIAATRAARQQRQQLQDAAEKKARQEYLFASPDTLFDPVPSDIGFTDDEHDAAIASMLRDARGGYKEMVPPQKFYDIIETLDDPAEQVRLSFDAFSDSDLLNEFRPRPRLPAQGGYR